MACTAYPGRCIGVRTKSNSPACQYYMPFPVLSLGSWTDGSLLEEIHPLPRRGSLNLPTPPAVAPEFHCQPPRRRRTTASGKKGGTAGTVSFQDKSRPPDVARRTPYIGIVQTLVDGREVRQDGRERRPPWSTRRVFLIKQSPSWAARTGSLIDAHAAGCER
ncbi:hypothetical protein BGZ61DRAFT_3001 [Ilyonectria robusta]|uniref:uncharacterized protein n=1 Tax=Ilyonectria robusta TaxID=1079257 RepID=UPI001E8D62F7|nr:uncharacterized protein BGZ61DRAFT_3001 [Ilyonectria robusta]KAH8736783.1 hypothetical protein BGZ61DRAFT_3001 [Ilyonectria robusta]